MLYSIIPPILIILSLAGIILFLMKKSSKIASLKEEDLPGEEIRDDVGEEGFFKKIWSRIRSVKWNEIKHALLILLEKITRKFRLIFLKLEAKFSGWSNDIKNRRKGKTRVLKDESVPEEKDNIMKKLEAYELKKKERIKIARRDNLLNESEEKKIRPIISDKVVAPQAKAEIKDRLEELLIERIAVNPKDVEAYERLGEYYMEIKNFDFAKECFKQIIKLDPSNKNVKYKMRRLENLMVRR